ncbi:hypothetical protein WNY51_04620 [Pseudocolwellia sp. AS88]|uniref:hypothetical protein n=1 Tax=Pseudocolwellia sp. AS88 TaxID=3063958 RepID=UPI0026ECCBDC|nr:hypothetical protein [Pseudocolwellia sp. AS88]MDO7086718.1 hypothetical protein [Pseudocolwellia sp. AS88]
MIKKLKLLAIASEGGHLVQLNRLDDLFKLYDTSIISTNKDYIAPNHFISQYTTYDINQDSGVLAKLKNVIRTTYLLYKIKPDVVISTGALPGLVCIVIAKILFRKKTIWVDSIANADELSKSGKAAKKFTDIWLTQWPELSKKEGPEYIGSII